MSFFSRLSRKAVAFNGDPRTFAGVLAVVLIWALTGPVFHFSDTWQLVINTGTTIITCLIGFLVQGEQNQAAVRSTAQMERIESLEQRVEGEVEILNRKLDLLLERAEVFPLPPTSD